MLSTYSCGSDSDGVHTLSEICVDVLFQVYYPITVSPILGIHIMLCVLHTVWMVFLTLVSTWYPLLIVVQTFIIYKD